MENLTRHQARRLKERNRLALVAVGLAAVALTAAFLPLNRVDDGGGGDQSYCVVNGGVACAVGVYPLGAP